MQYILLILSAICTSLLLSRTSLATPVLVWSNRDHLSKHNSQYLGQDVTFSTFESQILKNIVKESPDLILAFVTPPVTMSDLTKYGDVYSTSSGKGNGCLSKTKAAILKSASSLSIDEVLPDTTSVLAHLRRSLSASKDYCFVEISTRDQLEDNIRFCNKLVAIMETHSDKNIEQSLIITDNRIEGFLQLAEENNLHHVSLLLGNNPSQIYSRSRRSNSVSTGSNSTDTNSTVKFVIRAFGGVILFRAQNFLISMNGSAGTNQTYRLTQNNTQCSNYSTNNRTTTYFEITTTAVEMKDVSIKFSFPTGSSNFTSTNTSGERVPNDYWSMYLDVTVGSSSSPVRLFPPRSRIIVPTNYSFHCTPITNFTSKVSNMVVMFSSLQKSVDMTYIILKLVRAYLSRSQLDKLQPGGADTCYPLNIVHVVQPYGIPNSTNTTTFQFDTADDCVGFFTIDIWMGIFAAFVIFSLLYCAVMATMAISTSDRIDDPQGKPLMMEGATQ